MAETYLSKINPDALAEAAFGTRVLQQVLPPSTLEFLIQVVASFSTFP